MPTENITIKVTETGARQVARNIESIGTSATKSQSQILSMMKTLNGLNAAANALRSAQSQVDRMNAIIARNAEIQSRIAVANDRTAISAVRLATENQKLQAALARVETELLRGINAQNQAAISAQNLAAAQMRASTAAQQFVTEQQRTVTASNNATTAQQRLATEIQKTALATNNAAIASQKLLTEQQRTLQSSNNAATAAQRLATEVQKTATQTAKLTTAQNQAAVAAQRLQTELQRTAAAATQAAIAQTNLQVAQSRLIITNNNMAISSYKAAIAEQKLAQTLLQTAIAEDRAAISAIRLKEAQAGLGNGASRVGGSILNLNNALAAMGNLLLIGQVTKWADSWIMAEGKVNIFTHSATETNVVMERLFEIAQKTRQPIDGIASSFHQLSIAGSALGASQNQLLQFTQAVGNAFAIQGTDSNTARGGIIQLGQAMNEGIVRAQEYNSMINAMPIVLKTVANNLEGVGGSLAKLRQRMLDGKLYSKDFFNALLAGQGDLEKLFERSGKTFGQAFTIMENGLKKYVGELNKASGASRVFYDASVLIADNISDIVKVLVALVAPRIMAGLVAITRQLWLMAAAAAANPYATIAAAIITLTTAAALYKDEIILIKEQSVSLGDYMSAAWDMGKEGAIALGEYLKTEFLATWDLVKKDWAGAIPIFEAMAAGFALNVNNMVGTIVGFGKSIGIVLDGIGPAFKDSMVQAGNGMITALESTINKAIELSNTLRTKVGLDAFSMVKIDRIENPNAGKASQLGAEVKTAFTESLNVDYIGIATEAVSTTVGGVLDNLNERALAVAKERQRNAALDKKLRDELNLDAGNGTGENFGGNKKLTSAEKAAERAAISLKKYVAEQKASTDAANGMATAYLAGNDAVSKFTRQQEIETQVAKRGEIARIDVTKAVNDHHDALERLDVSKAVNDTKIETADMQAQTAVIRAQIQSVDAGRIAQDAYNVSKALSGIIAGKNSAAYEDEKRKLEEQTKLLNKASDENRAVAEIAGLIDSTATAQEKFNKQLIHFESLKAYAKTPEELEAIRRAIVEAKNETSIFAQLTEGAIDRMDSAWADMWKSVFDGSKSTLDGMKNAVKQWLAETAHMLITKPLMVSFGNMVLGTNKSGGIGDVLGQVFGNSNGGNGGSGGLGSMVGIGKNLYQAWNTVTGVGSSIASGYASGGISGAISGGVGYYGNLLSSLGTTLSGGFSSIVGAITGSTATQVAANAATSAALQGAVAQGAAQVGTSIGIGGAAQIGASAAAGAGTAAAAGAGAGFYASLAAMASNPVGWVIAAVTSAYQSGKLYDQGVRWNTKDVMNTDLVKYSGGIGQATLAPLALTNNVLEKVVGGKMAAIFSGSTFASAIITKVSEKIFGGSWTTRDGGISLGIQGGDFLGEQYIDQKKKGGLFGKNKKRTRYSALDPQMQEALQANYYDVQYSVLDLFTRLNVSLNDGVMDGLDVAKTKISTKGKTGEEIQEAISKWFDGVADSMVSAVNIATNSGLGGYSFDGLTAFVTNLYSINAAAEKFGTKALEFTVAGGKAVEKIVEVSGGIEALTTGIGDFYDGFSSDMAKSADALAAARAEFTKFGFELPPTADGLREVVKGLDLTTEVGQNMFSAIVRNAKSATDAYTILEQRESAYRAAFFTESENTAYSIAKTTKQLKDMGVTLPSSKEAYRQMVEALDRTTVEGKKMYDVLMNAASAAGTVFDSLKQTADARRSEALAAVDNSFASLQRAFDRQKELLTTAFNNQNTSLNASLETSKTAMSNLKSMVDSLESALKKMTGQSSEATKVIYGQGIATLQSALAIARAGGSLSNFEGMGDALDAVTGNTTSGYSDWQAFERDQGVATNLIDELNTSAGKQLTSQEKIVANLESQIKILKDNYDLQIKSLDDQLAAAQAQLDALNGIDSSIISVVAAIAAMGAAMVAALGTLPSSGPGSAQQNTPSNNNTIVGTLYQSLFGRTPDAGETAYWAGRLNSGDLPYSEIANNMTQYASASDKAYMAAHGKAMGGYASGLTIVGETGPEAVDFSRGYVHTANNTRDMLATSNEDVVDLLSELLVELKQVKDYNKQSTIAANKTVKNLQDIKEGGIPMLVEEGVV